MAVSAPERLYYTGVEEADELIARDPFALLMGFALDQQVPVPTAFQGPLKLKQRLGTLDPGAIAATDPARLEELFREKPAIHRFPGAMAGRVQELAAHVAERGVLRSERLRDLDAETLREHRAERHHLHRAVAREGADPLAQVVGVLCLRPNPRRVAAILVGHDRS